MNYLSQQSKILFLILLLSLTINIIGLTWGLPANWHPDNKVKHVVYFLKTGDLNPHLFINPSFYIYCLWALCKVLLFFVNNLSYSNTVILCRIFTALIGTSTVFITYLMSKNIFGKISGLYSALFLALSAGTLIYSHFTIPAMMVTFLMILTLYNLVRHVDEGKNKYLYYSAIALGFAVSTKYTAILLFIFIILGMFFVGKEANDEDTSNTYLFTNALSAISIFVGALLLILSFFTNNKEATIFIGNFLDGAENINFWNEHRPEYIPLFVAQIKKLSVILGLFFLLAFPLGMHVESIRRILAKIFIRKEFVIVILLSVLSFCVGTPFSILDHRQFLHDMFLNWQVQQYCLGFTYVGTQWTSYLNHIIKLLGMPIFICSLLGMFYSVWSKDIRNKKIMMLFIYVCLTYIAYGSRALSIQRYIFPITPVMVIFGGALFGKYLNKNGVMKVSKAPILLCVVVYSFLYSFSVNLILLNDSRYRAERWIEDNITKDSSIGVFSYSRYLPNFKKSYKIYYLPVIHDKNTDFDNFLTRFKYQRFNYLVLSDMFYGRYLNSDQYLKRKRFYKELLEEKLGYRIIADFKYEAILNPPVDFANPRIVILRNVLK